MHARMNEAVRIIIAEDNGFAVWCEDHDGYMRNLERFLALCGKHKIRAIMCLGNDCSRPKPLWSVPKPGPQPYDIGYHGGRKKSQHGSFPGAIGFISADDPELRPKFFQMCGEVMEKYKDDDRVLLVYGTSDIAVKPSVNSSAFAATDGHPDMGVPRFQRQERTRLPFARHGHRHQGRRRQEDPLPRIQRARTQRVDADVLRRQGF